VGFALGATGIRHLSASVGAAATHGTPPSSLLKLLENVSQLNAMLHRRSAIDDAMMQ
jgi:hypothetical protein